MFFSLLWSMQHSLNLAHTVRDWDIIWVLMFVTVAIRYSYRNLTLWKCVCREHAAGATNDHGHSVSVSFLCCLSCEGACQQVQACSGAFAAPQSLFSTPVLFQLTSVCVVSWNNNQTVWGKAQKERQKNTDTRVRIRLGLYYCIHCLPLSCFSFLFVLSHQPITFLVWLLLQFEQLLCWSKCLLNVALFSTQQQNTQ